MSTKTKKLSEEPKERGIWRGIFPHKTPVSEATREEIRKALKEVIKDQAGVMKLLEKE